MPAETASTTAVAASNDVIVRKSIPGLKEPIISASNPACAPLNPDLAESTPSVHGRSYVSRINKTALWPRKGRNNGRLPGGDRPTVGRMGDMKVCIAIGPELWFERPGFP